MIIFFDKELTLNMVICSHIFNLFPHGLYAITEGSGEALRMCRLT